MVEQVAGRAGEELEKVALAFEIERAQAVSDFGRVDQRAEPGDEPLSGRDVRGRGKRERAQDVGQALEPSLDKPSSRSASRAENFATSALVRPGATLR